MSWAISFDAEPHDVTVTTAGTASRDGFFSLILELVSHLRWRPGMAILFDHSALDMSTLIHDDVVEIADFVVELDEQFGPAVCAILTPDPYAAGVVDVAIRYAAPSRLLARTFASRDRALAWLQAQKSGAS